MDPYSSPYIIPNSSLHNPFPHSLLRTRQAISSRANHPKPRHTRVEAAKPSPKEFKPTETQRANQAYRSRLCLCVSASLCLSFSLSLSLLFLSLSLSLSLPLCLSVYTHIYTPYIYMYTHTHIMITLTCKCHATFAPL